MHAVEGSNQAMCCLTRSCGILVLDAMDNQTERGNHTVVGDTLR